MAGNIIYNNSLYSVNGSFDGTFQQLDNGNLTLKFNVKLSDGDDTTNVYFNSSMLYVSDSAFNSQVLGAFNANMIESLTIQFYIGGINSNTINIKGTIETFTTGSVPSVSIRIINLYYSQLANSLQLLTNINDLLNLFISAGLEPVGFSVSSVSNICFPKDTPILTDQGIVHIQDINKSNTIDGVRVEHITKTTSIHKELVCFEKDSISMGYPSQKTIMTRNHKVFHGTMVNADTLLSDKIYLIPYHGEVLYNVLLEKNGLMNVNGLICETLDVNNVNALLYKSKYTLEEKNEIMKLLNDTIHNYDNYKKISRFYFENV